MKLNELLGEELYAQVEAKINEVNAGQEDKTKHVRFADLSEGGYISRSKFDDTVNGLKTQVTDLQGQISQRDSDLAGLNDQLTAAQADAGQLADAQKQLTSLQSKYDKDSKAWAAKNAKQAYEYEIRSRANELKFSSAAAKKEFIREAIEQDFKVDGETLLGYNDWVAKYKESDPGAFRSVEDPKEAGTPQIVLPTGKTSEPVKSVFNFGFGGVRPHDN